MSPRKLSRTNLAVTPLEERLVPAVDFTIDPTQGQHSISRFIYGIDSSVAGATPGFTLERAGGNRWTAYNWENNASNAGSDFMFQNDDYLGGGSTPGGAVLPILQNANDHNAAALITVPINGYVAADTNGGGDVRNSGPNYLQTRFKQEMPTKGAPFTLTPDPNDPFVYQDEFVNWVNTNFPAGQTDANRPIWYSLDNEPDLWSETHAEVHPAPLTYAELVQKSIDYATAIKSVAPGSLVFGPVNYGWTGYVNLQQAPDAGGRDFQTFYLSQMAAASQAAGERLIDALDVHWYPEATGGGVRITEDNTSPDVVAARLQAPRSLWDPTYTETSYITRDFTGGPIDLIHRLDGKIDANFPDTKLAVTEYNYGAGDDISGGIAQADVLGVFGREGVYAASQFPLLDSEPFVGGAFQMFRNFDGQNSAFGDTSVSATTSDVENSSVYASTDSANPNVLTLVAINKTGSALPANLHLNGVPAGALAKFYTLTSASSSPQAAGQATIADPAAFAYTMPAYSVTTIRINLADNPPPPFNPSSVVALGNEGGTVQLFATGQDTPFVNFRPLDSGGTQYTGLVSVALGDVTGDGVKDLIVAPVSPLGDKGLSADKAGRLFVYDGAKLLDVANGAGDPNTALLFSRQPFGAAYTNGLNIATGDVNGDGLVDIIVGSRGSSGGIGNPEQGRFVAIAGDGTQIGSSVNAFGQGYQKGCVVTTADFDGDGGAEVIVTRGGPVAATNPNKDLKVKVFRFGAGDFQEIGLTSDGSPLAPFAGIQRGGRITATDTDGDGNAELVVSAPDPTTGQILTAVYAVDVAGQRANEVSRDAFDNDVADFAVTALPPDGDGNPRLAVAIDHGTAPDKLLFLNPLTGAFTVGIDENSPNPFALVSGGVTLDGF
jgi:hypothetical protein